MLQLEREENYAMSWNALEQIIHLTNVTNYAVTNGSVGK